MIMPCMKATSAGERCGSVACVEDGRVLLGFPGAPGCTTAGGFVESVCCACAEGISANSERHTDSITHKIGATTGADQTFRLRRHTKSFTAIRTHPFLMHTSYHEEAKSGMERWGGDYRLLERHDEDMAA